MLLKTFDKAIFKKTIPLLAIRVPSNQTLLFRNKLEPYLLAMPRMKSVISDKNDTSKRFLLLNERITDNSLSQLPKSLSQWIFSQTGISIIPYACNIDYNYYTASEVLHTLFPNEKEVPSAYEQIGSIIHINLPDHLLPYKYVFGQVLLDKVPSCKTVVNKIGKIDSVFRTFQMEVIAGVDNTEVSVNEGNCTFQFDYRKVYWNSRLHHEHARLVDSFLPTDRIADMFCGVGPFVIPAAKKGCVCYANDLNPSCYSYLQRNIQLNHIDPSKLHIFNQDARQFIRSLAQQTIPITQVIMNLPESAESFCDVFKSIRFPSPLTIHCYMFSNKEDPVLDSIQRIEAVLGSRLPREETEGKVIRDVAPYKRMTHITFHIPFHVYSTNNDYFILFHYSNKIKNNNNHQATCNKLQSPPTLRLLLHRNTSEPKESP